MRPEEEGQGWSRAPRELGAEATEAGAGEMDVAEALVVDAESEAGAASWPRPEGWETWSRSRKRQWVAIQKRKRHK